MSRKPKLGAANPALAAIRKAPDMQLRQGVCEIDVCQIATIDRLEDRLNLDIEGLKTSIQTHGQRVPVLVRPIGIDQYGLIYGRRRLEACRELNIPVRAIVTKTDDAGALRDQIAENQERRDLSFIERAKVASELRTGEFLPIGERTNRSVAEVLSVNEATISQLLSVFNAVGGELAHAIGSAPKIGRPRWEELKKAVTERSIDPDLLLKAALAAKSGMASEIDPSDAAFEAVLAVALGSTPAAKPKASAKPPAPSYPVKNVGTVSISSSGHGKRLRLDLKAQDPKFISWLEAQAPDLINELHERYSRSED